MKRISSFTFAEDSLRRGAGTRTINIKTMKSSQITSKYVNLTVDVAFKRVFGQPANKDLLIALLNSVMPELQVSDITYLDKEKPGFWRKAKKSAFDVMCDIGDGRKAIIEMQVLPQKSFKDRAIYYSSHEILGQHKEGDEDYSLLPLYVVSFVNFNLKHEVIEPGQIVWKYSLREDRSHEQMSDALHYTFIELSRFEKNQDELANDEERFYFCMKHIHELKGRPENIAGTIFEKLFETAGVAAMNPKEYKEYISSMMTKADVRNAINYAAEQAAEKAREEGREEERLANAKAFKSAGVDVATIAKATGLSEAEVEAL